MKKQLLGLMTILTVLGACQKNEVASISESATIHATIENEDATKTVMDENNNIRWSAGDQIVIFKKTSLGLKYQIQDSYAGETSGYFSKVTSASGSDDFGAGMPLEHNIAYYPYSSDVKIARSGDNYSLKIALPSEQTYVPESFGSGSFPMAAVSEDTDLTFKNVCGGIKLQFTGTCKVASIRIEGKNNEKISGAAAVTVYTDEGVPEIAMDDDASTSVTLNCGDGILLNESTATEFIISLPPTTFTQGFTVTVTDIYGGTQTIETSKANEVKRTTLLTMPEVEVEISSSVKDLSENCTANCYIVSNAGSYKFTATKGNSNEPVGTVSTVDVLWETFGTDVTPNVGDLVKNVGYADGVISFETADTFKKGNAVIAAKDASGTILWSWHIWLTDQPESQVYYNDAGTMMDRNLGATSATPGNVGALGLLYQWGRKDPFLGSSSISSSVEARSTLTWPSSITSNLINGPIGAAQIAYAIANPTTFILGNTINFDWFYTGYPATDNNRWTTSSNSKSIYDPCPAGWRVPDGGVNGVWSKAIGSSSDFDYTYDETNKGINFSGKFGSASTIWYPASGHCYFNYGHLDVVGSYSYYWSASPSIENESVAYNLSFRYISNGIGHVWPSISDYRAGGQSVRCIHE